MKRSIAGLLLTLSVSAAMATNYYVAPTGKVDNDGLSLKSPMSIVTAFSKLEAGDTLFCIGGQYDLDKTINLNVTGTEKSPVCIFPYNDEKVILDFRNEPYGSRGIVISNSSKYIHLKGLTIRYTGKNALLNFGSLCTFEGIDAYGNCDTGIQMKGEGGRNLLINCDSHDNFDFEHGGTSAADFGGNADGFADKQYAGPGNTYRNCRAWNNSDDGWDFYQRVTVGGMPTVIERCLCMNNGPAEYDMRHHARLQRDSDWFKQFESGMEIIDDDGKNAYATLQHYPNFGNGNGFKLGGARTQHDVRLFQCVAIGNTIKGFDQNNNFGVMEIYNGTAINNGIDYGFSNGSGGSLTLKNCVSYLSHKGNIFKCQKVIQSHNSWNLNINIEASDFISLNADSMICSRRSDFSLPIVDFGRPSNGSSLVNQGVFVNLPYSGVAPDLGYFEHGNPTNLVATEANSDKGEYIEEYVAKNIIHPNAKWSIGYVTLPHYNYDHRIINYLSSSGEFNVMILDATNVSNDYSQYDLLVVSPLPGSQSIAISALRGYNKPMLLLKPFDLKATVWNWGKAANSHDTSVSIKRGDHPIFRRLNIRRDQLQIYSRCIGDGAVAYISSWNNVPEVITLASPTSIVNGCAIAEIPVGTYANGVRINYPFLMLGLSEHSLEYLTEAGGALLRNCCKYIVGEEIK